MPVISRVIKAFQGYLSRVNFAAALVLQMISGAGSEVKFGYAASIAALGDVWPVATLYVFPVDGGQAVEAVSTAGGDTHNLTIEGMDGVTGLPKTETVTLTGLAAVAVPGTWASISRAYNDDSTAFVGVVDVRGTGAPNANIFARVLVEDQQTTQTPYQVPADKVAVINNYSTALNRSLGGDASAIMRLVITRPGKVPRTQIRYGIQRSGTSNLSSDLIIPIPVGPGSRIQVTADPTADVDVSAEYSMMLIDINRVPAALLADLA